MSIVRPYISNSSISTWETCQLKFYFAYTLGMREGANKKALMGNIVHSVAEALGLIKIELQKGNKSGVVSTEEILDVLWDEISFNIPSILTKEEVDNINKSRINKQTYISECQVKEGDIRYGRDFVNALVEKSWIYYTTKYNNIEWSKCDKRDVYNWTWMMLEQLDIRKLNIIGVEVPFDLDIEHEDCKIPYEDEKTGEIIGYNYVRIKGFIDLIHEPVPGVREILDLKTGRRQDFRSGEEKTLSSLSKDLQLCLYKYIGKRLYPEIEHFLTSILFIRDGGLFTPENAEDSDEVIAKTIHSHIQELKNCTELKVLSEQRDDWRCKYLCDASKRKTFHSTQCDCEFIKNSVRTVGLEETTSLYKKEVFNV